MTISACKVERDSSFRIEMQIWITVHNYTFFPAPKMPFLVCSAAWGWPYLYCTGFTVQENSYKKSLHTGKKKKKSYIREFETDNALIVSWQTEFTGSEVFSWKQS